MTQSKSFGSLSGRLLARKGGAKPAMRPQAYRFDEGDESAADDDCGWNDLGGDMLTKEQQESLLPDEGADLTSIVTAPVREADEHDEGGGSPVGDQHRALAESLAGDGETAAAPVPAALAPEDEAEQEAFLARLEAESTQDSFAEPAPELTEERDARPLQDPAAQVPEPAPAPVRTVKTRAAPGSKAKAAFTLRLDKALHLKLRLACAFKHTSAQKVVTAALTEYLAKHHPDLPE